LILFRATGSFDKDDGSCPSDAETVQHLDLCNSIGLIWVKESEENLGCFGLVKHFGRFLCEFSTQNSIRVAIVI
jgi:hypothetical protein